MPKRYRYLESHIKTLNDWTSTITSLQFLLTFLLIACLAFVPFSIYIYNQNQEIINTHLDSSNAVLETKKNNIDLLFKNIGSALNIVSNVPDIKHSLLQNESISHSTSQFLSELLVTYKRFKQIGIINANGGYQTLIYKELGRGVLVPNDQLGAFNQKNFFEHLKQGRKDYVYVSQFIFEKSTRSSEKLEPTYFMAMPLFNQEGVFSGAITIKIGVDYSYKLNTASSLIDRIDHLDVINGDWFSHDLNPQLSLTGGRTRTGSNVQNDNPELWQAITSQKTGIFKAPNGIYTFLSFLPLASENKLEASWRFDPSLIGSHQYILINFTSNAVVNSLIPYKAQIFLGVILLLAVIFVAFTISSRSLSTQFMLEKSQQLSDLYQLNDAIIDNLGAALISIDIDGTITRFSKHAEKIFGYDAEEAEGSNVKILMRADIASKHDDFLSNYVKDTQAGMSKVQSILGQSRVLIARAKDGSEFPVDIVVTKVPFGESYRFVGIITDVSERNELQTKLNVALRDAESLQEEQTRFINTLLQDISQPMANIQDIYRFLSKCISADMKPNDREAGLFACQTLLSSISHTIEIASIKTDHTNVDKLPFNFIGMVNKAIRDIRNVAFNQGVSIDVTGLDTFNDGWRGDPSKTQNILYFLINYSLCNDHPDSIIIKLSNGENNQLTFKVTISLSQQDLIKLEPTNNKPNPPEDNRVIADHHYRKSLSFCYELTRLMGGQFYVENNDNQTIYTVSLPFKNISVSAEEDQTSDAPDFTGSKVLLAHSDLVSQSLFKAIVSMAGCSLEITDNPLKTMEILNRFKPDAIFIDMRHRTGDWTNCKKIKSDDPLVPIIAIIDYDNVDDEQAMRAKGIDDLSNASKRYRRLFTHTTEFIKDIRYFEKIS